MVKEGVKLMSILKKLFNLGKSNPARSVVKKDDHPVIAAERPREFTISCASHKSAWAKKRIIAKSIHKTPVDFSL